MPRARATPAREATRREAAAAPMRRAPGRSGGRAPLSASARLARSEARLLALAISGTALVCGLLVVYLAAYAHVTLLGIDQAQIRVAVRQKRLDNETLRADLAALQSPDRIAAAAQGTLGMTRAPRRVDYIVPPLPQASLSQATAPQALSLETRTPQVATRGAAPEDNAFQH